MSDDWKPNFPKWQDRFPDLVWWMELNEGKKVPRGSFQLPTQPRVDYSTGQMWQTRMDHRGSPLIGPVNSSDPEGPTLFREKQTELKYEKWQYELIVWCLQKILFENWDIRECYDVIRAFWRHLNGQAPLTVSTVTSWYRTHLYHKKEGILWP